MRSTVVRRGALLGLLILACDDPASSDDPCALGPDESQPQPERLCGSTTPAAGSPCNRCAPRCSFADGRFSSDTSPPGGGIIKPQCGSDGSITQATCSEQGWVLSSSRDCYPLPTPRDAGAD